MAELRYVDWDGLVYYDGKIKEYIRDRSEELIKMGGIVPFDELPDPSWQNLNYIYKITDKFTSNDRFENPGYIYEPGTWVQVVDFNETYLYIIFNEESIGGTADIDLSDYYTKREVDKKIKDAIESIDVSDVDLSNYYTKEEVDTLIPDDFATASDIAVLDEAVAGIQVSVDYIQEQLLTKANKSDLQGLATEEFVNNAIANIDAPEDELYKVDFNAPDYVAARQAYDNGKVLVLTNAAPDVNSYAFMNYVSDTYITFTKFLMSRSSAYGSFNTYYLRSDNTWELAKEVRLNKVEANVSEEGTTELRTIRIGKDVYQLPDLTNYVQNTTLEQLIQNINNTYVTNETLQSANYVTEQYVENNYTTTEQLEANYVTTSTLESTVETKVTEVIQEKVDAGEIQVQVDSISYDTW